MWASSSVPGDLCFRTAARASGLTLLSRAPLYSSCDFGGSLHHPGGRRQPVGPRCWGQKTQQWTQPATWHLHIRAPPPPQRGAGWFSGVKARLCYAAPAWLWSLKTWPGGCGRYHPAACRWHKVSLCECTRWAKCKVPSEQQIWAATSSSRLLLTFTSSATFNVPFYSFFFYELVFTFAPKMSCLLLGVIRRWVTWTFCFVCLFPLMCGLDPILASRTILFVVFKLTLED